MHNMRESLAGAKGVFPYRGMDEICLLSRELYYGNLNNALNDTRTDGIAG